MFGLVCLVWFGMFGLVGLVWYVWFGLVWFGRFGLVGLVWFGLDAQDIVAINHKVQNCHN